MKKIILRIPEIDYVLVHWPENSFTPWVAAWAYREDRGSWGQGHYFQTKESALMYLADTFRERFPHYMETRINQIMEGMINVAVNN